MNKEKNTENKDLTTTFGNTMLYEGFLFFDGGKYKQGEIKILYNKDLCCPFCSHGEEFIIKLKREYLSLGQENVVLSLCCPSCFEKPIFSKSGVGISNNILEEQKENILKLAINIIEFHKRNSTDFICV